MPSIHKALFGNPGEGISQASWKLLGNGYGNPYRVACCIGNFLWKPRNYSYRFLKA